MVQWSVGTKVTSDPPALHIQPTPNLLFSEQMDSSLFPFTAVCSFTVWRSSYKGRQHGPASSHTQIHKGLCADSNNKHTQCGPVRVWHLKIKPEECFLWRLRAATVWGQDLLLVAPRLLCEIVIPTFSSPLHNLKQPSGNTSSHTHSSCLITSFLSKNHLTPLCFPTLTSLSWTTSMTNPSFHHHLNLCL